MKRSKTMRHFWFGVMSLLPWPIVSWLDAPENAVAAAGFLTCLWAGYDLGLRQGEDDQ